MQQLHTLLRSARSLAVAAALAVLCLVASCGAASALGGPARELVPNVSATNAEIAASLQRNGFSESFSQAAANLSSNMENRGGKLALYNGSCCTGVLQMTGTNLRAFCHCSHEQYAGMTLDQQTMYWGQLTRSGFTDSSIRRLDAMTTFDGQPVDDAMKLACVQLGVGNCRQMLNSGSCSGFKDGNGTTICKMAAAIRNGANTIGNTRMGGAAGTAATADSANGGNNTVGGEAVTERSARSDALPMGNPIYCWSCDAIVYALAVTEGTVRSGLPAVMGGLLPLMAVGIALGLIYRIMLAMVAGIDPVRQALPILARAALVLGILGAGGATLSGLILDGVVSPVLNGGAALGRDVAVAGAAGINVTINKLTATPGSATVDQSNTCSYGASAYVTLTALAEAENAATSLACTVHQASTTAAQIGVYLSAATGGGWIASTALNAAGALIAVLAVMGMLRFGLLFMDVCLGLAVMAAFMPWSAYAWVFDSTRPSWTRFWRRLAASFLSLVVAGLSCVAAVLLLLTGIRAGAGLTTGAALSPAEALLAAQAIVTAVSADDPKTMAAAVRLVLFTVCGALASSHVIEQSQSIVEHVTGAPMSKALSAAATGTIQTVVGVGGSVGAAIGGAAIGQGGRMAGGLAARFAR